MNNGGMETVKNILKGIWEFCSFLVFTVVGKKELIDESNSRVSQ